MNVTEKRFLQGHVRDCVKVGLLTADEWLGSLEMMANWLPDATYPGASMEAEKAKGVLADKSGLQVELLKMEDELIFGR